MRIFVRSANGFHDKGGILTQGGGAGPVAVPMPTRSTRIGRKGSKSRGSSSSRRATPVRTLSPTPPPPRPPPVQPRGRPDDAGDNAVDPIGGNKGNRRRPQGGFRVEYKPLGAHAEHSVYDPHGAHHPNQPGPSARKRPPSAKEGRGHGVPPTFLRDRLQRIRSGTWLRTLPGRTRTCRQTTCSTRSARHSIGSRRQPLRSTVDQHRTEASASRSSLSRFFNATASRPTETLKAAVRYVRNPLAPAVSGAGAERQVSTTTAAKTPSALRASSPARRPSFVTRTLRSETLPLQPLLDQRTMRPLLYAGGHPLER